MPALPQRDAANEWSPLVPGALQPGWYRCALRLPCAGSDTALSLEAPNGAEVWIDGTPLVSDGGDRFAVPPELRTSGDPVWLVLRLTAEGLAKGAVAFHCDGRGASLPLPLDGTWQVRTDEGDFSRMPLPAKFGASPDNYAVFEE